MVKKKPKIEMSFEKAVELGTDGNKRNAEAWIQYVTDRKGT